MIPCTPIQQPQANAAAPRAGSGQHSSPSSGAARASAGEALVWHFVCDEICDVLCEVLCDDADDVDDAARGAGAPGVDLAVAAAPLQFPPPTAHERSSAEIQRRLVELTADEPAATAAVLGPLRKCWRAEEEAELRELVEEHRPTGSNEWRQVAELLGTGRSASAVENRWRKVKDRDARSSDPSPRDPDESERRIIAQNRGSVRKGASTPPTPRAPSRRRHQRHDGSRSSRRRGTVPFVTIDSRRTRRSSSAPTPCALRARTRTPSPKWSGR